MTKYILLVSVLFASVSTLSAMPTQQNERQVQDEANGIVMVGERKECGPLITSASSLEDEAEYAPSSDVGNDKHHTN